MAGLSSKGSADILKDEVGHGEFTPQPCEASSGPEPPHLSCAHSVDSTGSAGRQTSLLPPAFPPVYTNPRVVASRKA